MKPSFNSAQFIKLLQLTQSPNDHEALSAIRKCNAILKDHDTTWDGLMEVAIVGAKTIYANSAGAHKAAVEAAVTQMRAILAKRPGFSLMHILFAKYNEVGDLNEPEMKAIAKEFEQVFFHGRNQ